MPLAVATDCDQYLSERLELLEAQLATVNRMAAANDLPDAIITESGLKITPLDAAVPDTAQALIDQTSMILPHVKITELLLEVDEWTDFTRHFSHLKSGDLAKDKHLLLTTILADAINLGLTKMAESCPGTTCKHAIMQACIHVLSKRPCALSGVRNGVFLLVMEPGCLQAKLAMRAETDELQYSVIRFAINQHQVRLDVAVPVILPIAVQRVVAVFLGQRLVVRQVGHDGDEITRQRLPMRAFGFALVVALELAGLFNRPHSSPPSSPRR